MRPTFRSTPDFVVGIPICRANWRFASVMPSSVFQLKPPLFMTIAPSKSAVVAQSIVIRIIIWKEQPRPVQSPASPPAPATSTTSNTVPMKSPSSPKRLTGQ